MTPRKPNQNMNRQFEIICLNKGGNAGVLWLIWIGGPDDSHMSSSNHVRQIVVSVYTQSISLIGVLRQTSTLSND